MKSFYHTLRLTESVTIIKFAYSNDCYTRFASPHNVQSRADSSLPLSALERFERAGWLADQPERVQVWVATSGFAAALSQVPLMHGPGGTPKSALAGYDNAAKRVHNRFLLAAAAGALPNETYRTTSDVPAEVLETECFGCLMTSYVFDRYAPDTPANARRIALGDKGLFICSDKLELLQNVGAKQSITTKC